jgi:hypothetical protein
MHFITTASLLQRAKYENPVLRLPEIAYHQISVQKSENAAPFATKAENRRAF